MIVNCDASLGYVVRLCLRSPLKTREGTGRERTSKWQPEWQGEMERDRTRNGQGEDRERRQVEKQIWAR